MGAALVRGRGRIGRCSGGCRLVAWGRRHRDRADPPTRALAQVRKVEPADVIIVEGILVCGVCVWGGEGVN